MEKANSPLLHLRFHGDLSSLIRNSRLRRDVLSIALTRRASIKDIIESLGIPHTEVGTLTAIGAEIDFSFIPQPGDRVDVLPISADSQPTRPTLLRPEPLDSYRFLVDINVSRLSHLLRMAGFDAVSVGESTGLDCKEAVAAAARRQKRILLSRDRDVLKLRILLHGRLIRNQHPHRQLHEVVNLYRLQRLALPFTRCMRCNHPLAPVTKAQVLPHLEPLTKKYYSTFSQCTHCGNIYWQGSHYERMLKILNSR